MGLPHLTEELETVDGFQGVENRFSPRMQLCSNGWHHPSEYIDSENLTP